MGMERQYVRQDDKAWSLVEQPFVQENWQDEKGEPSEKIQGKTHSGRKKRQCGNFRWKKVECALEGQSVWRGVSERGAEVGELGTSQACRRRSTTYFQRAGIFKCDGKL